ncbi:curli biogenesis system outer membrane secretion channel CsgG [Caulobacter ginsengisoli]|uniref:Curli biogenesis system outer membrane secretion channel CsgG n=1 Tax=Caulobacter ginsengisoli TaxID=400775 RepID=A0ABU0INI4_9CAUL|nr:CsgG/HfaB family protein [Caulobacter ginsengisoli]MDQ0463554.1 curli biogenesis system outer membrane secretion channel CsgG [Caulobacter ginsengisoli]
MHELTRRHWLAATAAILIALPAQAATPLRVTVVGFGASSLLGSSATEESLVALLIEELLASGGFAVIEAEDAAGDADPPRLLRASVTKFETKGGAGLDIGGLGGALGGRAGVGNERIELAVSLRLLDGATKQVLALATGTAQASGRTLKAGIEDDDGRGLGGERKRNPAIEQACRAAIHQAVEKLAAAAQKLG